MIGLGTLLLLSLIGAGASAGAGIASSAMQKKAQEEANATNIELQKMANEAQMQQVQATNEFNAAEAQKQRDWETEMSNTSMQRAMADYSAAGVNPLLALPGGAVTPSGASAQGNVAQIKSARVAPASLDISAIGSAIQSMTNFMLTSAFLENSQNRTAISAQNAETKLGQSLHLNQLNDARTGFYRKMTSSMGQYRYRGYRG